MTIAVFYVWKIFGPKQDSDLAKTKEILMIIVRELYEFKRSESFRRAMIENPSKILYMRHQWLILTSRLIHPSVKMVMSNMHMF